MALTLLNLEAARAAEKARLVAHTAEEQKRVEAALQPQLFTLGADVEDARFHRLLPLAPCAT